MQYIFGFIIAIFLILAIISVVTWLAQWIGACLWWLWEAILMPTLFFLGPSILLTILTIGVLWGAWVSLSNYTIAIWEKLKPESRGIELLIRPIMISNLVALSAGSLVIFFFQTFVWITTPVMQFTQHVREHYAKIEFPAYEIRFRFPVWE